MSKPFDLIELHLTGGPWTEAQAEKIASRATEALRREFRYSASPYVADIRGEDTEGDDDE